MKSLKNFVWRKKKPLLTIVSSLTLINLAMAVQSVGNGGSGLKCVDPVDGSIKVITTDLWHAETGINFLGKAVKIVRTNEDSEVQFKRALEKILSTKFGGINRLDQIIEAYDNAQAILADYHINAPLDAHFNYLPDQCIPQGIISWSDADTSGTEDDFVTKDQTLMKFMSPTDLAAIKLHEVIYKVLRTRAKDEELTDSVLAQKLTAAAFSPDFSITDINHFLPSNWWAINNIYECDEMRIDISFDHEEFINQLINDDKTTWGWKYYRPGSVLDDARQRFMQNEDGSQTLTIKNFKLNLSEFNIEYYAHFSHSLKKDRPDWIVAHATLVCEQSGRMYKLDEASYPVLLKTVSGDIDSYFRLYPNEYNGTIREYKSTSGKYMGSAK